MKIRAAVTAIVVLLVTGALSPRVGTGQPVSPGGPPAWPQQGGAPPAPYGYPAPAYAAPPPGGYATPGAYAPPSGGYPAPAGPAPGYPPAASYAPSGDPALSAPPPAYQPPYAYPQRGQNPQQAATDQSDCGAWASQQTGFDPKAPVGSSSQAGAAGASSPAGVFGGIQRREERRDLRRQQLAGQGAAVSQQDGYMRALNACLTARGYTVR